MKIQITQKQAEQFNFMLHTLKKISKAYMTPEKLRKQSEKEYGLEFEECIEMAYDNIQSDAANASKGIRPIVIDSSQAIEQTP